MRASRNENENDPHLGQNENENPNPNQDQIPGPNQNQNQDEEDQDPTIVDCDVLEAAKENVQPLGTGRRVSALSTILTTPHAQRDARLADARLRLRRDVARALAAGAAPSSSSSSLTSGPSGPSNEAEAEDGDAPDALEAYTRLVSWTLSHYPQGPSVDSGLLELLEEATRVLLSHAGGRWRGEVRYLKLWLLYAGFVERPTVVYAFLVRNEVGTGCGLLYEEWAAVLERDGRRKEADEAYALGIARRAQPLEHLKARHDEFQRRMMANVGAPLPRAPTSSTTSSSSSTARGILGSRAPTRPAPASNAQANAGLRVFVDPTGAASASAASEATQGEVGNANAWTDIGTRKGRVKENVAEKRKMVGTTVRRTGKRVVSASSSSAGAGRIPVFVDPPVPREEAADVDAGAGTGACTPRFRPFRDEEIGSTPGVKGVMKAAAGVLAATSEMEALRRDPLKNYPEGERCLA
ncbi:hypothetical protein C0992_011206 [Termitomyces sp. T32_za158]|nr:hypothetical protein C0992_011206 [Termitomyces sp. T32_za158]